MSDTTRTERLSKHLTDAKVPHKASERRIDLLDGSYGTIFIGLPPGEYLSYTRTVPRRIERFCNALYLDGAL